MRRGVSFKAAFFFKGDLPSSGGPLLVGARHLGKRAYIQSDALNFDAKQPIHGNLCLVQGRTPISTLFLHKSNLKCKIFQLRVK